MARDSTPYLIQSPAQVAALAAPVRQDIVDALSETGPMSVGALAALLGRAADSLYYHLKILRQAGLVVETGRRAEGGRPETLFDAVSPDLRIDSQAVRRRNRGDLEAIVSAMLRLSGRDYARALKDEAVVFTGPERSLVAQRKTHWMTAADLKRFNRLFAELERCGSAEPGQGRLFAVTVLLTPLTGRRNSAGRAQGEPEP
jgi:DNA-binding transcriptional ArsR family regulator